MDGQQEIGKFLREECAFVHKAPIDGPLVQKLTRKVECRGKVGFGEVEVGPRAEWDGQQELYVPHQHQREPRPKIDMVIGTAGRLD